MDAPWRWLAAGWRDLLQAPVFSLGYGLIVVGGGLLIVYALWGAGLSSMIPVAFGVFALVGPLLAGGLYEISRRLEAGEPVSWGSILFVRTASTVQLAYLGFFLMFALLVWVRIAFMLFALFSNGNYVPLSEFMTFAVGTPAGLSMLAVGTVVGGAIAFAIFLLTVVSAPMLMAEKTDLFTAVATGLRAFFANRQAMTLWAWLIAILTVASVATFFVGLAVVFPLLGHATWHAYRDIRGLA